MKAHLLQQLVFFPKNPTEKGNVVDPIYHISCSGSTGFDCDSTYVGETERSLSKRIKEHLRPSSLDKSEVATRTVQTIRSR